MIDDTQGTGADLGVHASTFTATVPGHDALLLRMLPPSSIKSNCSNYTRFLEGNQCDDESIIGAGSMRKTTGAKKKKTGATTHRAFSTISL